MTSPFRRRLRAIKRAVLATMGQDLYARPRLVRPTTELGSDYGSFGVWLNPLDADSVLYSVGVGDDVSFDLALMEATGASVHAFDPTPHSVDWVRSQSLPEGFRFEAVGLAAHDGTATFHLPADPGHDISAAIGGHQTTAADTVTLPVHRLATLMAARGHAHIDVLKMDVEGAEYDILDDVLASDLDVRQILVEVHHFLGDAAERRAGVRRTQRLLAQMQAAGYALYAVSSLGHDYSFAQASLAAPRDQEGPSSFRAAEAEVLAGEEAWSLS